MPQPSDYDKTHLRNLAALQARIDRIFRQATEEAARIGASISAPLPADRLFSFDDFPRTQADIAKLTAWLQEAVEVAVVNGVRSAWTLSNNKNNALSRRIFGDRLHHLTKEQQRRYFTSNLPALDAFLQRTTAGLNLSDRVWRYTDAFKHEIEMALDLGIRTGESAAQMTRSLRQYLQHPDKLFRRVRDRHGLLRLSQAANAFHPGTGVYRSSYRNARRLAATETNIAYRTADHLRWQQMDFVVGIEIQLSNNHTVLLQPGERTDDPTQQRADGSPKANAVRPLTDICDTLAGRYPKDFKFTGWHPHCRCRAVTILKTDEELARDFDRILAGEPPLHSQLSANAVAAPPVSFTQWLEKNATRIQAAQQRGTLPYFIKDNQEQVERIKRIEANRKEYERLKADPNYKDVEFNPQNGGLKATHINHIVHKDDNEPTFFREEKLTSTVLELLCQNQLFSKGFSCILLDEKQFDAHGKQLPQLDTETNGHLMDIRAITEKGEQTIKNALKSKKKQIKSFIKKTRLQSSSVILYFHDETMFDESQIHSQLGETIKYILCVFKTGLIKEYKKG